MWLLVYNSHSVTQHRGRSSQTALHIRTHIFVHIQPPYQLIMSLHFNLSPLPSVIHSLPYSPHKTTGSRSLSPIMGGEDSNNHLGTLDIQRALDIARNTEGDLDPTVSTFLESEIAQLWSRIQARPNEYVLTKDEFAVFNFFVARFNGSDTAEKAIARYWRTHEE